MTHRRWIFTLNNPDAPLALPEAAGYLVYQQEVAPGTGTKHFQGYVEYTSPQRLSAVRKHIPRAHWEPARGTQAECIAYCTKEDSRDGSPTHLGRPSRAGVKRDYDSMIDALKAGDFDKEEHLHQYIRHKRAVDSYVAESKKLQPADLQVPELTLRAWQEDLIAIVKAEPHERTVYWWYDTVGGAGKSTFTKYLIKHYRALSISTTAKDRALFAYAGEPIVVLDITRQEGTENKVNYSILETLKNGFGFSPFLKPEMKLWKIPHVIVFSNFPPDESKLSADRWNLRELTCLAIVAASPNNTHDDFIS